MTDLSAAQEAIRGRPRILVLRPGTPLYHQGDPASLWYEVADGLVRTCRFHSDGHRQLTGFYYPGDVFGLDEGSYKETAETVTAAKIKVHRRRPAAPAEPSESEMDGERRPLRRALENAQRCIFLLGRKTATQRVAAFLLAMPARTQSGRELDLPMSRSDIGDHLGLTLHTVSRTVSELARRGVIALDGPQNVHILDPGALRRLAGAVDADEIGVEYPEPAGGPAWREPA